MHFSGMLRSASEAPAMKAVRELLKTAMREGDGLKKNVYRAVLSAAKNAEIAKPGSVGSDVQLAGILRSLEKRRTQSIEQYIAGKREDLAATEKQELEVLRSLHSRLAVASPEELRAQIAKYVESVGNAGSVAERLKAALSGLPKDAESVFKAPRGDVAKAIRDFFQQKRAFVTAAPAYSHDNPLGLRRRSKGASVEPRKARIPGVKHVVLVSSAKGGVGKSTVAANLARALVRSGKSAGLLDVDIYGPSVPSLLGFKPTDMAQVSNEGKLLPLTSQGVKAMSMGFLIPEGKAVSWRGLLVQKALEQLLFDVEWGSLEYLVVDMPPGTGDIQLTVCQRALVNGAVVVTTNEKLAVTDAVRGLDQFAQLNIKVLGIIENMVGFRCPCCQTTTPLFNSPQQHAESEFKVPVLAKLPLFGANQNDKPEWDALAAAIVNEITAAGRGTP